MDLIALLDNLKIPFEIPTLLHSPVVHFAIAIPVIALLLELINIFAKKRCIGFISGLLIFLAMGVYFAAFLTGKVDGKEAYALLSAEGKEELLEHKKLGIYLVYATGILFLIKLIVIAIRNMWGKIFFILILAGFVAAALKQGKDGGELVYEYGANVKAVSQLDDKIMELEEQLESLKAKCNKDENTANNTQTTAITEEKSNEEVNSSNENNTAQTETNVPENADNIESSATENITNMAEKIESNLTQTEANTTE